MGWTGTSIGRGCAGEYFKNMLTEENEHRKMELLKGAFVGWREYYGAIKITDKESGKSFVTAFVCMIDWRPKDVYNFYYKDMDETCGPNICRCPKSILELLSPLEDTMESRDENGPYGWAKNWRKNCWEYANSIPVLKNGDIFNKDGETWKVVRKRGKGIIVKDFFPDKNETGWMEYRATRNWLKGVTVIAQAVKLTA